MRRSERASDPSTTSASSKAFPSLGMLVPNSSAKAALQKTRKSTLGDKAVLPVVAPRSSSEASTSSDDELARRRSPDKGKWEEPRWLSWTGNPDLGSVEDDSTVGKSVTFRDRETDTACASRASALQSPSAIDIEATVRELAAGSIPRDEIMRLLAKPDASHNEVLHRYLRTLPLKGDLVHALRAVSEAVSLKGEAQQVDRILQAFAEEWTLVNQSVGFDYQNKDIVYGVVFSLILLNTDMYSPTVRTKMSSKSFIANTLQFVDGTLESLPKLDPIAEALWRRDLEVVLKGMYDSVRHEPLLQRVESRTHHLQSLDADVGMSRSLSVPNSGRARLFSHKDRILGPRKSFHVNRTGEPVPAAFLDRLLISGFVDMSLVARQNAAVSPTISPPRTEAILTEGVTLEGLLYRKIVAPPRSGAPTFPSTNRVWIPFWCVVHVTSSRGVDLCLFDVDPASLATDATPFKIPPGRAPAVVSLLHAVAKTLPSPGYNAARRHCFYLTEGTGAVSLFQAQGGAVLREWCDVVNFWAARRSGVPLRGGNLGSAEYGWGQFEWERWREQGVVQGKFGGKEREVDLWEAPRTSGGVCLLEEEQLEALKRYLSQINDELQDHLSYKGSMQSKYAALPVAKTRALENWGKKWNFLEEQRDRYELYIRVFEDSRGKTGA
ncbi:hypothetical protein BC830DRAFT_551724 [Chytriomyces sp. MP71]|nr:hypothetical protein BC830DRAFT_551724 [Chytriomyces sp. MP71]